MGNHPFFTRSSCSNTSLMVQNEEKANTPSSEATKILSVLRKREQRSPRGRDVGGSEGAQAGAPRGHRGKIKLSLNKKEKAEKNEAVKLTTPIVQE